MEAASLRYSGKISLLLCALLGTTLGAPVYGEDGGYLGYASYDPSKGRQSLSGESSAVTGVHKESVHPDASRRHHQTGGRRDAAAAPRRSASRSSAAHHKADYLSKPSRAYSVPLKDNYVSPHHDTQYGHQGGYKISDIAPRAKQNVYSEDYQPHDQQPYEYGYEAKDEHGNAQSKKEASDGHKVQGSYGYVDEHGLFRRVDYVADKEGFRARVKTNEPGTDNQNPADVLIESEQGSHKY